MEFKTVANVWHVDLNEDLAKSKYFCKVTLMDLQTHQDFKLNVFGVEKKIVGDKFLEFLGKDIIASVDLVPFAKGYGINQVFVPVLAYEKEKVK